MEKPGIKFEKLVYDIQKRLDPNTEVTHNEFIVDRLGHRRQFDVIIRGTSGGHPILGVIECKDLKKRVGTPEVDAFVTKSRDINANFSILASRKGFSKPDIEKAKDYGIGTISLLLNDGNDPGLTIGVRWFAEIWQWKTAKLKIDFSDKNLQKKINSPLSIKYKDKIIINWFLKQLATQYLKLKKEGDFILILKFDKPQLLSVDKNKFEANGITFNAFRDKIVLTKVVHISGDAIYRWDSNKITLPPNGIIHTENLRSDFSDWDKYDDIIPPLKGFMGVHVEGFIIPFDPKEQVVDLMKL